MNKGIIIGIIIAVAIAIGFGVLMSSDNTIQSPETDEIAGYGSSYLRWNMDTCKRVEAI